MRKMNNKPVVAGIGELLWDMLPEGKQLGGLPPILVIMPFRQGVRLV